MSQFPAHSPTQIIFYYNDQHLAYLALYYILPYLILYLATCSKVPYVPQVPQLAPIDEFFSFFSPPLSSPTPEHVDEQTDALNSLPPRTSETYRTRKAHCPATGDSFQDGFGNIFKNLECFKKGSYFFPTLLLLLDRSQLAWPSTR